MKVLRIILQLLILGVGGSALVKLISRPDPDITFTLVFIVFLGFLFALTLVLKEHTDQRLVPGYKLSPKPMGFVLLLLGMIGLFSGASFLMGRASLPNGGNSCRAVCGLMLLVSQLLGETAARVFAFGLFSSFGVYLCFIGYKVLVVKKQLKS